MQNHDICVNLLLLKDVSLNCRHLTKNKKNNLSQKQRSVPQDPFKGHVLKKKKKTSCGIETHRKLLASYAQLNVTASYFQAYGGGVTR